MPTHAEFYQSQLQDECMLTPEVFRMWIQDLDISDAARDLALSRVQINGGLSHHHWIELLWEAQYLVQDAQYYIDRYNPCGWLCMDELVLDIVYKGSGGGGVTAGIFADQFTFEFS